MSEGQKGGEFYTPTSIVKLLVEVLEPFHGRILDLACGSGGMFVQSARFVMANSASDARGSEQEIRRQLIETPSVDVMVAVGPNLFYTVTLPCTLWFLDRGKKGTARADTVLFLDAQYIYRQIDRAHRDWTPAQIGFLANVVRLYRGEAPDFTLGGDEARAKLQEVFCSVRSMSAKWLTEPTLHRSNTATCPAFAAPRRSRKSRRKAGRSTPVATSASPPART